MEVRQLIREMSIANPFWGAPRIHGELLKLGIDVGQSTVAKYIGAEKASAIPRMEDVSSQSRGRRRVDGPIRGSHDFAPTAVWIFDPTAFPP